MAYISTFGSKEKIINDLRSFIFSITVLFKIWCASGEHFLLVECKEVTLESQVPLIKGRSHIKSPIIEKEVERKIQ